MWKVWFSSVVCNLIGEQVNDGWFDFGLCILQLHLQIQYTVVRNHRLKNKGACFGNTNTLALFFTSP